VALVLAVALAVALAALTAGAGVEAGLTAGAGFTAGEAVTCKRQSVRVSNKVQNCTQSTAAVCKKEHAYGAFAWRHC
jgi:hypothetical protein